MTFDIQYLLWLQDLRAATGGMFDELFNALSKFAVTLLPILPFVVFWCVDKKWGYRFMSAFCLGEVINGLIKLTVCAYRPWIRSDLIEPAGDSKVAATGYSFPSGHTMCATAGYGTAFAWQRKKRRWLAILCAVLLALTGFSRNFLGVHTPQDVLVAFCESALLVFIIGKVQTAIDGDQKKLDILSIVGIAACVAVVFYITLKSYPMDYVDGVLLADPYKMQNDTFSGVGMLLGLIAGSYIDRHHTRYEIPVGSANLAILTSVGAGILIAWDQYFAGATVIALLGAHWGRVAAAFLTHLFAIVIWPAVIRRSASERLAAA